MSSPTPGQYGQYYPAPPSVASQVVSEDAEEYDPEGTQATGSPQRTVNRQTSRPTSPPQSFRTNATRRSWRGGSSFVGPGLSMANPSRPQSATSRKSTSHAPSITSRAFFRPMSSQRLQQQRAIRPFTATTTEEVPRLSESSAGRMSIDSNIAAANQYPDLPRPSSRTTDMTERDPRDRAYHDSSPLGAFTAHSTGESTRPLQSSYPRAQHTRDSNQRETLTPKTPVSYTSNKNAQSFPNKPPPVPTTLSRNGQISKDKISPFMHEKPHEHRVPSNARNYQYFTGNVIFFWGGRLQNTRHRPVNIITGALLVAPAVLFFVFSAPYLWYHVSPAIPIVFGYLFYICLSSFVHASVTDPGILPRNIHPLPITSNDPLAVQPTTEWTMIKSFTPQTSAMDYPTKYCKTCNIWRPPRTHHCRICDNCSETQDHHCVWLNNCVGRRNYRFFFTFVSTAVVLGLLLSLASIGQVISYSSQNSVSFGQAISDSRVPFAMFIYGLLIIPYPISLTGYHIFLMGRAETTREYLNSHKFAPADRHRPFDQGNLLRNWLAVLLRQRTPTYLRFKDRYVEGDPRFGPRRGRTQPPLSEQQQGGAMEMQTVSGAGFRGSQAPLNLDLARQ